MVFHVSSAIGNWDVSITPMFEDPMLLMDQFTLENVAGSLDGEI